MKRGGQKIVGGKKIVKKGQVLSGNPTTNIYRIVSEQGRHSNVSVTDITSKTQTFELRTKTGEPNLMCCFLNNHSIYSIDQKMWHFHNISMQLLGITAGPKRSISGISNDGNTCFVNAGLQLCQAQTLFVLSSHAPCLAPCMYC